MAMNNIREKKAELIDNFRRRGFVRDEKAFTSFMAVPRESFVPKEYVDSAYRDHPLPLMNTGQTISAPHMTIMILEYLELEAGQKILEIGAGSGYQAALIAAIVDPQCNGESGHVYSIEIVPELVKFANYNLERAGFAKSVTVIEGDGTLGYKEQAPFDRIIITAAGPILPPPLWNQLIVGGCLVMPIGQPRLWQQMIRFRKKSEDEVIEEVLSSVAFVPLRGKHGI